MKFPDTFYKYLPKKYAQWMVEQGVIRLGTLLDFRAMEGVDSARGDQSEGTFIGQGKFGPTPESAQSPKTQGLFIGATEHLMIANLTIQKRYQSKDAHIFCMSATRSPALLKEFKVDSCVEIFNPDMFNEAIALELIRLKHLNRSTKLAIGACQYFHESKVDYDKASIPPWIVKDVKFSIQDEYRFAYDTNPKGPLTIRVPKLHRFCRLISL